MVHPTDLGWELGLVAALSGVLLRTRGSVVSASDEEPRRSVLLGNPPAVMGPSKQGSLARRQRSTPVDPQPGPYRSLHPAVLPCLAEIFQRKGVQLTLLPAPLEARLFLASSFLTHQDCLLCLFIWFFVRRLSRHLPWMISDSLLSFWALTAVSE